MAIGRALNSQKTVRIQLCIFNPSCWSAEGGYQCRLSPRPPLIKSAVCPPLPYIVLPNGPALITNLNHNQRFRIEPPQQRPGFDALLRGLKKATRADGQTVRFPVFAFHLDEATLPRKAYRFALSSPSAEFGFDVPARATRAVLPRG